MALAFVMVARTIPSAHAMTATFTAEGASGAGLNIYDNTHDCYNGFTGFPSVYNNWIEGDSYTISATLSDNANGIGLEFRFSGASYSNPYDFLRFTVTLTQFKRFG